MAKDNQKKDKLVLIDGHSLLFRAFHAYPELTTKTGELVNAVYGFTNILLTVIKELEPTHIAVSFDLSEPTFRHNEFEGYKASRPEAPAELISQQERVAEVIQVLNIPIYAVPGFEADDVIGTLAVRAADNEDMEVVIVTGDRDELQMVDRENISVYTPGGGKKPSKIWGKREVKEKYGLEPEQLVDFKALAGDASDEIPGVKGIGPKTATKLLGKYKTLDWVYKNLDEIREELGGSVFSKLDRGKESAYLSKKLAKIVTDVPLEFLLEDCLLNDYDKKIAIEKFKELEFRSLVGKLPKDKFEQMVQEELF